MEGVLLVNYPLNTLVNKFGAYGETFPGIDLGSGWRFCHCTKILLKNSFWLWIVVRKSRNHCAKYLSKINCITISERTVHVCVGLGARKGSSLGKAFWLEFLSL